MRDHEFFEGFIARNQMRAQGYVDAPEGRILLADSDDVVYERGRLYYRTGYALMRDGLEIGNYADYELGEEGFGNNSSDQDFRLNQAVTHARMTLAQLNESGFFDDGRKDDFPVRTH